MDSLIKPFNAQKASFGRHETFALRYAWLTKGFQAFENNPKIFSLDEATIDLGVGKNMVNAIKYWCRACSLLTDSGNDLQATPLGKAIFSENGWDVYLEDEATLWLIHWLLASNAELATAWYWFFNCFHKTEFTSDGAAQALADFVQRNLKGKHSERTVKQEIALILRMYCPPNTTTNLFEDSLDAPLSSLKLVSTIDDSHLYRSAPNAQSHLPIHIVAYATNEIFNCRQIDTLPINELMYGKDYGIALGSVFRLTENALVATLENIIKAYPTVFEIRESSGIHQLARLTAQHSSDFLRDYYQP